MSFKDKTTHQKGGKYELRAAHMDSLLDFYRHKYRTVFATTKCRHAAPRIWIRSFRRLIRLLKAPSKRTAPSPLPAPLMQTVAPSCDNETSDHFEHITVLDLSEQRRKLQYLKGRTKTEDLE